MISLIVGLIVCGIIWWLIQQLPIAEPFMTIIRVVVIIAVILWLLQFFGIATGITLFH